MEKKKCEDSLTEDDIAELDAAPETHPSESHEKDSEEVVSYSSESSEGEDNVEFDQHHTETEKNLPRISESASRSRNRESNSRSGTNREGSSYNRSYTLTSTKHKKHPESVQRSPSESQSRLWNSRKNNNVTPKEELPTIEMNKKTKYNYLSEGKSSHSKKKKDIYHLENDDEDETRWLKEAHENVIDSPHVHDIRKKLNDVDFNAALQSCSAEGPQTERCKPVRSLFKVFSKNKELITPEDLHELLLLFTAPGVALREATDFLWEECDQKNSLNFQDFLRYGEVLRLRLLDFETFLDLTDEQKLLVTSARVFPGVPTTDYDKARVRLMMANRQQADGNISPEVRPLRIYEHLFLDYYQRKLYRKGLLAKEEAASMQSGDLSSDLPSRKHNYHRDSDEDISWGEGATGSADRQGDSSDNRNSSAEHRNTESDYPALASCNRSNPKALRRVKRGKALTRKGGRPPPLGTRPGNIPFAQRQKPPFNLDFQTRPSKDKYIGRIIEDEYDERRAADDYLLRRIQENFMYA